MKQEVVSLNGKNIRFEIATDNGNDVVFTDSITIADVFGKKHKVVIRAIEDDVACNEFLTEHKIVPSEYTDRSGKKNKMYLLDRDAFSYYVMGFTGEKAKKWKLEYIKAFNNMEKTLKQKQQQKLPSNPMEILELVFQVQKDHEKKLVEVETKVKVLEDTKRLEGWQEKKLIDLKNQKVFALAGDNKELATKLHRRVWSLFKKNFSLPRYNELPAVKFNEGVMFINKIKLEDML